MNTLGRKICFVFFCCVMFCFPVFAVDKTVTGKNVYSWDFSDCEIRDILYVVSLDTGISIVSDDTVSGKADFRFTGKDFEKAFDSFLKAARLYVVKKDEVWTVSRFRLVEQNGLYSVDACDLSAEQIVEKLSLFLNCALTYEVLPAGIMNLHFKDLTENELLENVCLRLNGYELEKNGKGYHLSRKVNGLSAGVSGFGYMDIHMTENGGIFVDVKDSMVNDVLEAVFGCAGKRVDFCVLTAGDSRIKRTFFIGRNFEDTLEKLCAQNDLCFVVDEEVYYVMPDVNSREKLLNRNKDWFKVTLEYTRAEKFVAILERRFGKVESIVLPDEMSLLVCADMHEKVEIEALKKDVDLKTDIYLIELKYIRPEEFMKHLPPDVDKGCLFFADDNSGLYFKGTEAAYLNLCEQLKICDRPTVRLSYDLLILQYEEGKENSWKPGLSLEKMTLGDRNNFGFKLGNVLNLNFNVISAFGLEFAVQLQASLEENKTSVFADTTLHGVAGKQISFQNTNTYRYRDNNLDPATGKPVYSGVTKEIVSGLKLDVVGVVSGDGTITSIVTTSVTRQGMDTSASTGNPPPTSEKIVTTEVCGKSGEPIIISGLIQNSTSQSNSGISGSDKLVFLKLLFNHREEIRERTQMVIYLVPHIDTDTDYVEIKKINEQKALEQGNRLCSKICGENVDEEL